MRKQKMAKVGILGIQNREWWPESFKTVSKVLYVTVPLNLQAFQLFMGKRRKKYIKVSMYYCLKQSSELEDI